MAKKSNTNKVRLSVTIDKDVYDLLEVSAKKCQRTLSNYVNMVFRIKYRNQLEKQNEEVK